LSLDWGEEGRESYDMACFILNISKVDNLMMRVGIFKVLPWGE
jgi:hypothetical protein